MPGIVTPVAQYDFVSLLLPCSREQTCLSVSQLSFVCDWLSGFEGRGPAGRRI